MEGSFLQSSHTVSFYVMDNIFEGPYATCYRSSVKTQSMKKARKLHLLVQHSPLILLRWCCSARELKELLNGNAPSILVRGVTKIITNNQRKCVQNGWTHFFSINIVGKFCETEKGSNSWGSQKHFKRQQQSFESVKNSTLHHSISPWLTMLSPFSQSFHFGILVFSFSWMHGHGFKLLQRGLS